MTTIALNKLVQWKGNVRKTNPKEGVDELAASIAAHGLLNPLSVRENGKKYEVVAGQRRLMALQMLAKDGRIEKDSPIECTVIAADADASEISLAENVVRTAMHPADQFDAFRALIDEGRSVADVSARFGVSDALVTKRLKLGRVHPELLDLYRKDEMSLEQIQAFTITDDQAEQLRVWKGLQGWRKQPSGIREALCKAEIAATDKRVRFVGLDAYEAAGGAVRRDLFDEENAGWVADVGLLEKLVAGKLEIAAAEVKAEGWKWTEIRSSFSWDDRREFAAERGESVALSDAEQTEFDALVVEAEALESKSEDDDLSEAESDRLDKINERLEALENRPVQFTDATKQIAGAVIYLDYSGEVEVERGLVRKEDKPKADKGAGVETDAPQKSAFSAALVSTLKDEKTGALQAALAADSKTALAALVYSLALGEFDYYAGDHSALKVNVSSGRRVEDSAADKAMDKLGDKLRRGMPEEASDLLGWCLSRKPEKLMELLAYLVARSATGHARGADALAEALGLNLRTWFTPDAENYFSRVSKDQILADMKELGVEDDYSSLKKAELVKTAAKLVIEKAPNWVPGPMRPVEHSDDKSDEEVELEDDEEFDEAA